jgi:hypothetical protein
MSSSTRTSRPSRGLSQRTTDRTASSYLGPLIIAQRDIPVRIKFTNNLPTGAGGNLFIPVDTTLMGAGATPNGFENYTQNRAELHLHGGDNPWISDGTPYQWTTPAGEATSYPKGVAVYNVPDMPDPGKTAQQGVLTLLSNQQSARLMFYHDHAGITHSTLRRTSAGFLPTPSRRLMNGTNNTVNPNLTTPCPRRHPARHQDKASSIGYDRRPDPTWQNRRLRRSSGTCGCLTSTCPTRTPRIWAA